MERRHLGEFAIDAVVIGNVAGNDLQQIIDLAAHAVEFHHVGNARHALGKGLQPFVGVMGGLACLVHALVPGQFVRTGSNVIRGLNARMVLSRRRQPLAAPGCLTDASS